MKRKPCNVALGRFQPFTKGHLQMLKDGYDKNGYPAIVFMISNKKFDNKHPFSDELISKEMDIIKNNYDFIIETVPAASADIVKIGEKLYEMGYEAHLWLCGDDREAPFKRMAENPKYREQGHFPDDFTTYTGTGRTEGVSGTAVRDAIRMSDKEQFEKLMPKGTQILFNEFKNEIMKIKENVIGLSKYINIYESSRKAPNWKHVQKNLTSHDWELVREINMDGNSYRSSEDIEQELWHGSLKNRVDELYAQAKEFIDKKIAENEIVEYYGLARSGKQEKIEFIAQVFWAIEHFS